MNDNPLLQILLYILDGLLVILGWLLANKMKEQREDAKDMQKQIDENSERFSDYKEKVSDTYATKMELDKSIVRVEAAVNNLSANVTRLIGQVGNR